MKHSFIVLMTAVLVSAPCGCRPSGSKGKNVGVESGEKHAGDKEAMEKTGSKPSIGDAKKTIATIIEQVPSSLSRMEAIVGKIGRDADTETFGLSRKKPAEGVASLDIEFLIDIHHHDPFKTKDPRIGSFTLKFEAERDFCLETLESNFGKPRIIESGEGKVFRFDTGQSFHPLHVPAFYLFPGKGDAFRLLWSWKVPDFAMPSRTDTETEALTEKIVMLLKEGASRTRVEEELGKLSLDKDWNYDVVRSETWTFTGNPAGKDPFDRFTIYFAPPLPAKAIIEALGVKKPVVVSTNVHMTNRVIADYKTRAFPQAGGYMLRIHVLKEGLKTTDLDWPASAVWKGKELLIDFIEGISEKSL